MIAAVKIANPLNAIYIDQYLPECNMSGIDTVVFWGAEFSEHILKPVFAEVRANLANIMDILSENCKFMQIDVILFCHLTPIVPGVSKIFTNISQACLFKQELIFYSHEFNMIVKLAF